MTDIRKLKSDTINGFLWSSVSHLYSLAIQFIIAVILARLLVPDDFATIGLLTVFSLLCNFLIDSGFAQSLIREKKINSRDLSSVFYFNVTVAIIIYVLLFLLSPSIAHFFRIPEIRIISRVVFIQLLFNSLCIIPTVVLTRRMEYNKLSIVNAVAITISAISGITAALCGLGVYSLVVQMLIMSFVKMLLLWVVSKWKLTLVFSFDVIKRLFGFSMYLLATSVIVTLFNNLYTLIIGRYFAQAQLGYYTQAKKMEEIPSQSVTTMIANVSYTAMSKVKDDLVLLRIAYKKILGLNVYIIFPVMMFCLVSADSLIPLLFGTKWLPSVPYFKILCIYGMMFPLFSINGNILKVLGLGQKYTFQEIVRRILMLLFLLPTIKYGIEAMLWGWVLSMFLSILYSFILCGAPIRYKIGSQFLDLMPIFSVAIVSMLLPFFCYNYFSLPYIYMFVLQFFLYFSMYLVLSRFIKISAYNDVIKILKERNFFGQR